MVDVELFGVVKRHHRLEVSTVSWMTEPMMPSPSSVPKISDKVLEREKEQRKPRTFKNDDIHCIPDVAKNPFSLGDFRIHPGRGCSKAGKHWSYCRISKRILGILWVKVSAYGTQ
jgi:hypothetical protein